MYFEDQYKQLPALVPIKRQRKYEKRDNNQKLFDESNATYLLLKAFQKQSQQAKQKPQNSKKQIIAPQQVQQIKKKYHNIQQISNNKSQQQYNNNIYKQRQTQHSKHMISKMMQQINAKNITDQLFPITNQNILKCIRKIDGQVGELKIEAQKKENYLVTNPNNQLLKKELQTLKIAIDRCINIKELYNQKINLRNKVSILQRNIIQLKQQNQNLKIELKRQSQYEQQSNLQNNNNQRTLQLKDSLLKCKIELKKQKQMRQYFEANVNDLVKNFQRLYDQAEVARTIVMKKLKEVQEKSDKSRFNQDIIDQQNEQLHTTDRKKGIHNIDSQLRRTKTNNLNISQNINNSNKQQKTFKKPSIYSKNDEQTKNKQKINCNLTVDKIKHQNSLEQQIIKMRNNKLHLSKSQLNK